MNKEQYQQYLQSEHWKNLRAKKRASVPKIQGKPRCGICAITEDVHTHHLQYKNIYDVLTSDLRMLCGQCHEIAHQLIRDRLIPKSGSHHSLWALTKAAVKKARGLGNRNMFSEENKLDNPS